MTGPAVVGATVAGALVASEVAAAVAAVVAAAAALATGRSSCTVVRMNSGEPRYHADPTMTSPATRARARHAGERPIHVARDIDTNATYRRSSSRDELRGVRGPARVGVRAAVCA